MIGEVRMSQNKSSLAFWFVTDGQRATARIKYELKELELRLHRLYNMNCMLMSCPKELYVLFQEITNKYSDYLKLMGARQKTCSLRITTCDALSNWQNYFTLFFKLKEKFAKATDLVEEQQLVHEISLLYFQCSSQGFFQCDVIDPVIESGAKSGSIKHLFHTNDLELWIVSLVDFWNHQEESCFYFQNWSINQLQLGLDFFARDELVNLVNTLFYFKLYPDQLFNEFIHPEKLVSVRTRIGILYSIIETLQKQLFMAAQQKGLTPEVDYLFHGDELPQGIMIEMNQSFTELIKSGIKTLKVHCTKENEFQVTFDRLHDLYRAYKFWFNPNRLIDAVMVLHQRLVPIKTIEDDTLSLFQHEMVLLLERLSTAECLDLYGYFTNKDTRYLLYTLFVITRGDSLDWSPSFNDVEIAAIQRVFQILQSVMEALRIELKNRHILTKPYVYDLAKQSLHISRKNREAVLRIIAIYKCTPVIESEALERLFHSIEDKK